MADKQPEYIMKAFHLDPNLRRLMERISRRRFTGDEFGDPERSVVINNSLVSSPKDYAALELNTMSS
jgi:hypothetical protein